MVESRSRNPAARKLKHAPTEGHPKNFAQQAYDYAREIVADKKGERHCKWVRLAAKRHLDDLKKRGASWGYQFDPWHANDVCDFVEKFPHIEGSWESKTITLEPTQVFILAVVFGWRRKDDGARRFSEVYIEMARKGAKSTLTAPIAHYCLTCEGEIGPQVIIAATTGAQADKVFRPARLMAEKLHDYRERFGIDVWTRSIVCNDSGGFIQPINAKSQTQDGWNPHLGILDELHAHPNGSLYNVIKSAFGSRNNPLLWVITTAGDNINGICYERRTMVTKVLESLIVADHFFGIIFTLDEKDDPLDESKWIKANPLLGITPTLKSMRTYAIDARESSGSIMVEFKTKRLNLWTTAKNAWLNIEQWKACNGPVDLDALIEAPCYGGLDLASTSDISSFALVWIIDDRVKMWVRHWLPEAAIDSQSRKGNYQYAQWVEQGHLLVTHGNVTDYEFLKKDITASLDKFNVKEIGYDPWNATATSTSLMEEGAQMVQMRQGAQTFHPPMKELLRVVKGKMLDHGDDPVLNWMASNIVARYDQNQNMAVDRKSSQGKIDGMVAGIMGLGRALLGGDDSSVYDTRGILTFSG